MSAIPTAYLEIILPLIAAARGMLEDDQTLAPFAFVGNLSRHETLPILLEADSEEAKDASAATIRDLAARQEADFVFVIMEAWSLPPARLGELDEILERYGSIGASPYRIDVVSFTLETRHGVWVAQEPISPRPAPVAGRTFDEPSFQHFEAAQGRFAALLPRRDDDGPPATLH
jgi:hypothetical protein